MERVQPDPLELSKVSGNKRPVLKFHASNVKWHSHCGNKHEMTYDAAIPLLGMFPKEMKTSTQTILEHKCS